PKYCKCIDFRKLANIVNCQFSKRDHAILVEQEFIRMILSKSSAIKKIIIEEVEHPYQISNVSGTENSLSQLVELQCDTYVSSLFYYELAKLCKSIQKLRIIYCKSDNLGIASLIKVQ